MKLYAKMEDDSIVRGESNIPEAGKKIMQLGCEPANCKPTPDVVEAIKDADLIVVLDNGMVSEMGNHEELLARNEIYKDVYISQLEGKMEQ